VRTLVLREHPNAFTHITGKTRTWDGSDGLLYTEQDLPTLIWRFGEPIKKREVKYGVNITFDIS
jgi:hypothetical protein